MHPPHVFVGIAFFIFNILSAGTLLDIIQTRIGLQHLLIIFVLDQQIHDFKGNVLTVIRINGIKQDSESSSKATITTKDTKDTKGQH
jgi:hypothetical protein